MTSSQLYRVSGFSLLVGTVAFVAHIALRSAVTAGVEPASFADGRLWIPVNALGFAGAFLVLLGLPAMYLRVSALVGVPGFVGVLLTAVAWIFFGIFLSLYGMLLLPW